MSDIKYILLYTEDSVKGGYNATVRSFSRLENAQRAMAEAYMRIALCLGMQRERREAANFHAIKTRTSLHIGHCRGNFHWQIIQAHAEDGDTPEAESAYAIGSRQYLVTIEEHISQEFPIEAEDIAHAMDKAKEEYRRGQLVVQPSAPIARLMMARSEDTEEETEWKEF